MGIDMLIYASVFSDVSLIWLVMVCSIVHIRREKKGREKASDNPEGMSR